MGWTSLINLNQSPLPYNLLKILFYNCKNNVKMPADVEKVCFILHCSVFSGLVMVISIYNNNRRNWWKPTYLIWEILNVLFIYNVNLYFLISKNNIIAPKTYPWNNFCSKFVIKLVCNSLDYMYLFYFIIK